MKKLVLAGICMWLWGCSESGQREAVLKKSNELETAWNSFDQEGMSFLDTFKRVLLPWVHDSIMTGHDSVIRKQKFEHGDSLNKIFINSLTQLQNGFFTYEKQLVECKKNLHAFLSWKLLVTNKDIEAETAANDWKIHRNIFDSLSAVMRKAFRINNADIIDFRNFIKAALKPADTLNTTP